MTVTACLEGSIREDSPITMGNNVDMVGATLIVTCQDCKWHEIGRNTYSPDLER